MVKRSISLSFLIISFFVLFGFKTDCNNLLLGTKTPYYPKQTVYSNPPKGYEPVFINYVGRHGARHQTSINGDSLLFVVLKQAEKEKCLTEAGFKLLRIDSLLMIVEKGNVSFISELGKEEQQGIGARMLHNFNPIFQNKEGKIKISTTKKERTKQSAKAFLKGLNPDSSVLVFKYNDNDNLAFYDVSPAYKAYKNDGNWLTSYKTITNIEKSKKLIEELPKQFFTNSFIYKLNNDSIKVKTKEGSKCYDALSFVNALYDIISIVPSIKFEIENAGFTMNELDLRALVSSSDIEMMDYINSAEDFFVKGPGIEGNDLQVNISIPLLVSFINSTNDYIASKKVIANMRFAHAETISPFAALLGITGASETISSKQILDYNKVWKCENIIPLSANIQWVLYKNNEESFIIKLLLNEKEVTINNLNDIGIPYYYKWNDIRNLYTAKLEKMNVHLNDNMHDFLMNLK